MLIYAAGMKKKAIMKYLKFFISISMTEPNALHEFDKLRQLITNRMKDADSAIESIKYCVSCSFLFK
jgi:hypothetical protein